MIERELKSSRISNVHDNCGHATNTRLVSRHELAVSCAFCDRQRGTGGLRGPVRAYVRAPACASAAVAQGRGRHAGVLFLGSTGLRTVPVEFSVVRGENGLWHREDVSTDRDPHLWSECCATVW